MHAFLFVLNEPMSNWPASFILILHPLYFYLFLFFLPAIDWDHISRSTPPMKPSAKDINTATQSEIGSFQDEKISKKLILTEEDHKTYEKWDFLSKRSFQEEVVDFLTFEERVVRHHKFEFCCCIDLFIFRPPTITVSSHICFFNCLQTFPAINFDYYTVLFSLSYPCSMSI